MTDRPIPESEAHCCAKPVSSASKLEARILRAAALLGQQAIQRAIGANPSSVSRILSSQRGVHIHEIEGFLAALGMRVVDSDSDGFITLTREEYRALKTLALKALQQEDN